VVVQLVPDRFRQTRSSKHDSIFRWALRKLFQTEELSPKQIAACELDSDEQVRFRDLDSSLQTSAW